jgi:hypothetical protein
MEMIAAMQAFIDALDARLKAVESRPDTNVDALLARIVALEAFDKQVKDL